MQIQEILRGLLDMIEQGQAEDDGVEQANLEMLPVIDQQEVPIDIAQQEFDGEESDCGCDDDYDELDVVKRNAGLPVMTVITDAGVM